MIEITNATFEPLAEPPVPEWIIRVVATGSGLEIRAFDVSARVGDVPVEGLLIDDDRGGFTGYLAAAPPDGSHLFVGWDPAAGVDTEIALQAPTA